jgi:hypothetical protein
MRASEKLVRSVHMTAARERSPNPQSSGRTLLFMCYLGQKSNSGDRLKAIDAIGGCTRIRTLDPLMKSQLLC